MPEKRFIWDTVDTVVDGKPVRKERVRRLSNTSGPQEHFTAGVKMGRKSLPTQEQAEINQEFMEWERAISELGSTVEIIAQQMSDVNLGRDSSNYDTNKRELKKEEAISETVYTRL